MDTTEPIEVRDPKSMADIILDLITEMETANRNERRGNGVPTGFRDLDTISSGWQRGNLVILASRPAMGKSALALAMAGNLSIRQKQTVAVFSLEMNTAQITTRLLASESGIPYDRLHNGELSEADLSALHQNVSNLTNARIYVDDAPALSILEFREKACRLKSERNVDMIIVDYLQLMTMGAKEDGTNREQEINNITRSIKRLARELDIVVVVLSQLTRSVETRGGDKRPVLSDLRESGAIEENADVVCFLYRPEYYNIHEDEHGSTFGIAEVIMAKHRNRAVDTVRLRFIPELAKFTDLESMSGNFIVDGMGSDGPNGHPFRTITRPTRTKDETDFDDQSAPF